MSNYEISRVECEFKRCIASVYNNSDMSGGLYDDFINSSYIIIEEPKENYMFHNIVIESNFEKNYSIKPINVIFNIRKMILEIPEISPVVAGVFIDNWVMKIMAILSIIKWGKHHSKVEISKDHAIAIFSLHKYSHKEMVSEKVGFQSNNEFRRSLGLNELKMQDYSEIINQLTSIKVIEMRCANIVLIEKVTVLNKLE